MNARYTDFEVFYNKYPISGEIGRDIEQITYTDCASDNSDSVDITINAQDRKWLNAWMPEKGAELHPKITGYNWYGEGQRDSMDCGLFVLDQVTYSDAPDTLQMSGVARPSDTDFSERERGEIWKNTSIKRIAGTIAGRYGMALGYDAEDYDIECAEQDGPDSTFLNTLCQNYGLILKVYARRLWIYDREVYKSKRAVRDIDRTEIVPGSFTYKSELQGTYTGGDFSYTDADKDCDITAHVGGGTRTKSVNRRASSVADAAVQLCAEINNANHGMIKISFKMMGVWNVASGNNIRITGYGEGLTGGLNGKYFVDKVTHSWTRSGGFVTSFECAGIRDPFHPWEVGGSIEYHQQDGDTTAPDAYTSTYATTSPAAGAASAAAGGTAGAAVSLSNAPFYISSTAKSPACYKSGTFYYYDGILINGRYRMTNTAARCGKQPVGKNVTGWVPASYCNGSKTAGSTSKFGSGSSTAGGGGALRPPTADHLN